MTAFAFYLLKVMICSGVLFLYYYLALRNKLFHQWNRFYLLCAIVISLVAPVVQVTIMHRADEPAKAIQMLQVFQSAGGYLDEVTISGRSSISTDQWLLMGYIIVSGAFLLTILLSFQKIISILRSHKVQWIETIKFINTKVQGTPFSFFNFIFWNEEIDLQTETGQQIFQHELVHVKEKHTLDKLFVQSVLIVVWCNPFFWLIRRELKLIHEFIADKKAVGEHGTAALAAMILNSTYPSHFNSLTNQFFQTSIKRRIAMLAKIQNPQINYLSRILALSIVVFTVLAFTLRTKTVVSEPPKPNDPVNYTLDKQKAGSNVVDTVPKKQVTVKEVTLPNATTSNQDNGIKFRSVIDSLNPPLIILDGKEIAKDDLTKINADKIYSMTVLKGQTATAKYGEKAKNGAIIITTKGNIEVKEVTLETVPISSKVEIEASVNSKQWISHLQSSLAAAMKKATDEGMKPGAYTVQVRFLVLKDGSLTDVQALNDPGYNLAAAAIKAVKTGPKWNPGINNRKPVNSYHVQPITFKILGNNKEKKNVDPNQTFSKTEIPPSVDQKEWVRHLQTQLQSYIENAASKGMAPGTYTIQVNFIVLTDGSLTEVKALNDPGFGLAEAAVKTVQMGPKWKPALQNGKTVNAYHTQPITFIITEGDQKDEKNTASPDVTRAY